MISSFDRIQVTAFSAEEVAGRWIGLLGGHLVGEDQVALLNARRLTVAVGDSHVEVLEPLGSGPVEEHLRTQRGGPLAAGFASPDVDEVVEQLTRSGVPFHRFGEQLFLNERELDLPGLRVVISPQARNAQAGRLQTLYEATHLTADPGHTARRLAQLFALDANHFVPIDSEAYGYRGSLTLFHPEQLDRIETITPFDESKTMGRYFKRFGPALYMCFAECGDIGQLRETLMELVPKDWTGPREGPVDSLFIHPRALGGVMLGVSRTTFAWSWSGSPARVRETS